jgi:hypothetical protein
MRARIQSGKRARLIALLALMASASAVLAPSAVADRSDCPAQYLCLWDGPTYGGARAQFHDNGWQNLTDWGFNDITSSVFNNTNRWATIAEHINGGGMKTCFSPGEYRTFNTGGFPSWDGIASPVNLSPNGCS